MKPATHLLEHDRRTPGRSWIATAPPEPASSEAAAIAPADAPDDRGDAA